MGRCIESLVKGFGQCGLVDTGACGETSSTDDVMDESFLTYERCNDSGDDGGSCNDGGSCGDDDN